MIEVTLKNKEIQIPNEWNELDQEQYVKTIALVERFFSGDIETIIDFRLELLVVLTGYKRSMKQFSQEAEDTINSNLVILSENLRFPIVPDYKNPELLETLSEDLQVELLTRFPFEITEPEYLPQIEKISELLKVQPTFNYNLKCNPISLINLKGEKLIGPSFSIDNQGVVVTDLITEEYLDAQEYYKLYITTHNDTYLNHLIATLYRPKRKDYSTFDCQLRSQELESVDPGIKRGVYVFFQSLQEYFCLRSKYSILFSTGDDSETTNKDLITLGAYNSLYQLSKSGYGSHQEVKSMGITDFMNLLLKQLIDAVHSLRAMKKNNHEIAKELEMDIEIVTRL